VTENRKPSVEIRRRLATNVKRMRRARGYTQQRLAQLSKLTTSYIGNIEQKTVNVSLANLEALASGLGCLEAQLLMPLEEPGGDPEDFFNALQAALTR